MANVELQPSSSISLSPRSSSPRPPSTRSSRPASPVRAASPTRVDSMALAVQERLDAVDPRDAPLLAALQEYQRYLEGMVVVERALNATNFDLSTARRTLGVRLGAVSFDYRMSATTTVESTSTSTPTPDNDPPGTAATPPLDFRTRRRSIARPSSPTSPTASRTMPDYQMPLPTSSSTSSETELRPMSPSRSSTSTATSVATLPGSPTATVPAAAGTDPLKWFGLLTPPALRSAQERAGTVVDTLVAVANHKQRLLAAVREFEQLESELGPGVDLGDGAPAGPHHAAT
ncbi:hypothetical protein AMAG_20116 [Allomyces macrogynus ATCC 38327]|uniref:Vacuolar ATPase assembly protein VMA22 n=1 Tax=Allomyces macrogynus (strain ATCC 38327) TaxID=578462 RepID=A0A0L0T6V1_ALLM3|nr:hypothetical protein AMAG_20116 [Allomyces macrogynus ATCC 38327]|eukprot:KNE70441.1 hypothetical protein AMAG_20116 [Allomyces macrogynus ATCC 38327]